MNLLEQAFYEAGKLPADKQEEFARWILRELAKDRWKDERTLSLEELIEEANQDYLEGRTIDLDPSDLDL